MTTSPAFPRGTTASASRASIAVSSASISSLALVAGADWERNGAISSGNPIHHEVDVVSPYAQLIVEPIDGLVLTGGRPHR